MNSAIIRRLWAIIFCFGLSAATVQALPQFSLMTGNRCLTCHVNAQGGGIRSELGWYAAKDASMINPKDVPLLRELYALDGESNAYIDGQLTIGMDLRGQMTRSPRSDLAERRFFPMQLALYGALNVIGAEWLTLEGGFDAASLWQSARGTYPGQSGWSASALIQPGLTLPLLRVGHFQPTLGVRYDDHTMLIRQISGAFGRPLLPPMYADWGAELQYDGLQWLSLAAGAFLPRNLSAIRSATTSGEFSSILGALSPESSFGELLADPVLTGRIKLWLRTEDHALNSYVGGSTLYHSGFQLWNAFAGVGLTDRLSLMGEYMTAAMRGGFTTQSWSLELTYRPFAWLYPYVRYEQGQTQNPASGGGFSAAYANNLTIGAQWFPLPYIELRPEWRLYDTERYASTRWNLQVHVFY
jgi:hypothetical protein